MRALVTFLFLAVLAALPATARAQEAATSNFSSSDEAASVQAYGEQTANYSTGCVQVDTYEKGTVEKVEVVTTGQYTELSNEQSGDPCQSCGTEFGQREFEINTTTTNRTAEYTVVAKSTTFVGHADMTSMGGMSLCSQAGISAEGSLYQTQTVNQNASGPLAPGVTGSASYTGTQTFSATIQSQSQ